jgi:hypothetical protein
MKGNYIRLISSLILAIIHFVGYSLIFIDMASGPYTGEIIVVLSILAAYVLFRAWNGASVLMKILRISAIFFPIAFIFIIGLIQKVFM